MSFLIPTISGLSLLGMGRLCKNLGSAGLGLGDELREAANHGSNASLSVMTLMGSLATASAGAATFALALPLACVGGLSVGYGAHKFTKSVTDCSNKKAALTGFAVGILSIMVALR